jgi:hypothetical protein
MMAFKQPREADFEASAKNGAVEVHFKPTDSYFTYTRLADKEDIAKFGPLSLEPNVRHAGPTGDFDEYSADSAKVYDMARRAALKYIERE